MSAESLAQKAEEYLNHLCRIIPTRRVGTQGNRDAAIFFKRMVEEFGFEIERQPFNCIEMRLGEIRLSAQGQEFEAFISPHSLGCDINAELVCASNIDELRQADVQEKILLLHGDISKEQLMPKSFVFYNPEEHQLIYRLLEEKNPAAVITATSRNPEAVGAIYPFPMIEDGDFDIPVAYMTSEEGSRLARLAGKSVDLMMESYRLPSSGENIIARKGAFGNKRVVVCAHIDTKENTPGALDNASGVIILLLLAELLKEYRGKLGIEFVALNGEEYYCAPGQMEYLRLSEGYQKDILLAINLDDIGYHKDRSAYSLYGVSDDLSNEIRQVYASRDGFFEGPAWFQSDHGIFISKGIPAMAITEESFMELLSDITHSPKDTPEIVDPGKLAANAQALYELVIAINANFQPTF